jgi:hypothetical protein
VGKGCRCLWLTTLPPSCANCLEIWELHPPGTLSACPGLYRDTFTFIRIQCRRTHVFITHVYKDLGLRVCVNMVFHYVIYVNKIILLTFSLIVPSPHTASCLLQNSLVEMLNAWNCDEGYNWYVYVKYTYFLFYH